MTSSGDSRLSFACPHCHQRMTAPVTDAGQRRPCPKCGKTLKLPGVFAAEPESAAAAASESSTPSESAETPQTHAGIANISLICPTCGTRVYATSQQIGESMVCPDCLEAIVVRRPSPADPPPPSDSARQPKTPQKRGDSAAESPNASDDEDEFSLSDPVELPRNPLLPKELAEFLAAGDAGPTSKRRRPVEPRPVTDDSHVPRAADPGDSHPPGHDPSTDPPQEPEAFRIQCPACDTLFYASADEIGKTKTCPDCYSEVLVRPPVRPAPKRVEIVDDEGSDFALGEAADLAIYRQTLGERSDNRDDASLPPGLLEKARQAQSERERHQPKLPKHPLWTGLFRFFLEAGSLARASSITLFLSVSILLIFQGFHWMDQDGVAQFSAMLGFVSASVLLLCWIVFATATSLFVLQQSADGFDRFSNWPEVDFMEWMLEGLFVIAAGVYAATPGMMAAWLARLLGLPQVTSTILVGISLFLLFPIVQLSLLEGASLASPCTRPILDSLQTDRRLWLLFYAETGALGFMVALIGMFVPLGVNVFTVLMSALWTFALLTYYRLLGRLAWACQAYHDLQPDEDQEQKGTDH